MITVAYIYNKLKIRFKKISLIRQNKSSDDCNNIKATKTMVMDR